MRINRNSWSFVAVTNSRSLSREEALATAAKYGLEEDITYFMEHGYTPNEALAELDIL